MCPKIISTDEYVGSDIVNMYTELGMCLNSQWDKLDAEPYLKTKIN